jgi:ribosome-associated translation inhibitor RaiA
MQESGLLEEKIQEKVTKLRKLLPSFPEDAVHLQVVFEKHPKREEYTSSLNLSFPQRTLYVSDKEADPLFAVHEAFNELFHRVKKFKSKLNQEREMGRRRQKKVEPSSVEFESIEIISGSGD